MRTSWGFRVTTGLSIAGWEILEDSRVARGGGNERDLNRGQCHRLHPCKQPFLAGTLSTYPILSTYLFLSTSGWSSCLEFTILTVVFGMNFFTSGFHVFIDAYWCFIMMSIFHSSMHLGNGQSINNPHHHHHHLCGLEISCKSRRSPGPIWRLTTGSAVTQNLHSEKGILFPSKYLYVSEDKALWQGTKEGRKKV